MVCKICKGSGNHLIKAAPFECWECLYCGGVGVSIQYGPSLIGPGTRRKA